MPRYVKSESEYEKVSFDSARIKAAMTKTRAACMQPTAVALDPELVEQLKAEAMRVEWHPASAKISSHI